jgi:hypothetical protein
MSLSWHQSSSGLCGVEKNLLLSPSNEPQLSSPYVVSISTELSEVNNAFCRIVSGVISIRIDLGEVGWGDVDWIDLAQDRNRWRAVVNSVLNLRVP